MPRSLRLRRPLDFDTLGPSMADLAFIDAMRRFVVGKNALLEVYRLAWEAAQARQTEVTITAQQFAGGGSTGQIAGNPRVIMESAEILLKEIEAEESGQAVASAPVHVDFSTQPVRT
jgi:hypothetical protein